MYVRLAFAVAAHLEPEILIVDEVLAVGDAEFQQKCLGKMRDVARATAARCCSSATTSARCGASASARSCSSGARCVDRGARRATSIAEYMTRRRCPTSSGGRAMISADTPRLGTGEAGSPSSALTDETGAPTRRAAPRAAVPHHRGVRVAEPVDDVVVEFGITQPRRGAHRHRAEQRREGPLLDFAAGPAGDRGRRRRDAAARRVHDRRRDAPPDAARRSTTSTRGAALRRRSTRPSTGTDHYPWSGVRGYVRPRLGWSRCAPPARSGAGAEGG